MLTFDIGDDLFIPVDANLSNTEFLFNINGTVHGHDVFSDGIFYLFKGGKMLNCCLSQINKNIISQIVEHGGNKDPNPIFQTSHLFKATNLPKSFGANCVLSEHALGSKVHAFNQFN